MRDELDASAGSDNGSQSKPDPKELPDSAAPEPSSSTARPPLAPRKLPDALRNWQVLEVDGQATRVVETATPPDADTTKPQIADRSDDWIVASLDIRQRSTEAGAPAIFAVTVLNNGSVVATFHLQVEGWVDTRWAGDSLPPVPVEPGGRATLTIELTPPRRPEVEARDYHLGLVVRSPEYPNRFPRIGAILTVLPFEALEMSFAGNPEIDASLLRRSITLPLRVTNGGNKATQVRLHGTDPRRVCRFAFGGPGTAAGKEGLLSLRPNQSVALPVQVSVRPLPVVGMNERELPLQITATLPSGATYRTRTQLAVRPLLGPWQMASAAAIAAVAVIGFSLLLLIVFLLARRPDPAPAATAALPQTAPPSIIIVNLGQPASAPVGGVQAAVAAPANGGDPGAAGGAGFTSSDAPNPALPLVLPDQVSAPGGAGSRVAPPAPAAASSGAVSAAPIIAAEAGGSAAAKPQTASAAATAPPAQSDSLSYGQMFQDVGRRYDLDWKMLAAQAYVESGFDSLALSDSGAMGLMQVLPGTWREWAPAAEVSDPFDSYGNVLVAAVYLDHLRTKLAEQGYPGKEWMLVAYNWGPDKVNDFLASGGTWDTLPDVRKQYVTEILRIAQTIP